jgi:spermidine synthase
MSRRIERSHDLAGLLGWMQVLMGICALGTLPLLGSVFELMQHFMQGVSRTAAGYQLYNLSAHLLCLLIMLPATFFAGTTLPLMTYLLIRRGAGERAIGAVYAANTLGAICGVLIAVHALMPMLGLKGTVTAGASLDLALGLALLFTMRPRRLASAVPAAVVVAALAGTMVFVQLDPRQLLSGVYRSGEAALPEDAEVLYLRDGKTATVGLIRAADGVVHISTNGKTDAALRMAGGDFSPDEATMILAAILPLAAHPNAKSAANIGMGSGLTTHTLLATDQLERVDTIEIERFMIEAASHFGPRVERAFVDARSHIFIEDAKTFFSSRNRKYDIIISEPSNPWVSGVATLFSEEFYQRVGRYLEDDGVLVQWLQLYEADLSLVASIVKALSPHFSDYVLYNSNDSDLLLVARKKGSLAALSDKVLVDPRILHELARIRVTGVQDLEARKIGSKRTLDAMFQSFGAPANSDYFPYVDQNAARTRFMRMAGIELTGLTVHFLPILEMLNEEGSTSSKLTQTAWLTRARAVSDARQLRTALLERRYGDMPRTVEPDVLLPYLFVDACDRGRSEELWIDAMVQLAGFLTPYLPPEELAPIWRRLEREPCFKHLTRKQRAWFDLVQAVGRRDPDAMASQAERLLDEGDAAGAAPRVRYAVLSAMLGHIVRGTPGKAWLLWAKHGSRLMPMDNPPLDARLLLALTGPESHFAKRGRKSKTDQVARVTSGTPMP